MMLKDAPLSAIQCPAALAAMPAWVMWRFEQKPGELKPRKVPFYVNGRRRGGPHGSKSDREQLATFFGARDAAIQRGMDGVGFCPLEGASITVLDLDNCAGPGGDVHPDAERLVAGTYAEFSPSGRGVHAFFTGDGLANRKDAHGEPFGLEVFSTKGFVTFTGRALPITELTDALSTIVDVTSDLRELCAARFGRAEAPVAPANALAPEPLGLTSDQLREALGVLDPEEGGYDGWRQRLMQVHHETRGSEEGFQLVDEWSSRGATYQGTEHVRERWDSFGKGGQRPVTAIGLVLAANDQGARIELAQLQAADDFEDVSVQPSATGATPEISFVDFASLAHTVPAPRRWIWDQWLPRGSVTVLYGRGGHGKSLLAQQLAVCVAKGLPFAGAATQAGPVLGLFAEDDADELLRRGSALYAAMGLDPGDAAGLLHLDARAGKFNTLVSFGRNHLAQPTKLMKALREQCDALRPVLLILDNIAQLFAGDENIRHEVTAFCNELTGVAREFDCAALLLGHLAKSEESEYSGSTAWDAAVRSRLLLARQDDGTTLLRRVKANYSNRDEARLEWQNGAFAALPTARDLAPETLDAIKPQIVKALQVLTARKQAASHLKTARNYLVKLMREEIALHDSIRPELLDAALRSMLDSGEVLPAVELPWKSSSRHAVTGLALP